MQHTHTFDESDISRFETFGQLLRFFRNKQCITLRELAEQCGFSPSYLLDIEKGSRNPPSQELLHKLMDILLLSEDERNLFERMACLGREAIDDKDLVEYLCLTAPSGIAFIKLAKEMNLSDEYFQSLINALNTTR